MMVGGGEERPLIEAPAVAEIVRRNYARPCYLAAEPLAVEPDLWRAGRAEMEKILQARGWPVCVADIKLPNYLLHGVPIVMDEA